MSLQGYNTLMYVRDCILTLAVRIERVSCHEFRAIGVFTQVQPPLSAVDEDVVADDVCVADWKSQDLPPCGLSRECSSCNGC